MYMGGKYSPSNIDPITGLTRAPGGPRSAGEYRGTSCPAGMVVMKRGSRLGARRGPYVVCGVMPAPAPAAPPPPPKITVSTQISPSFQQAFRGQVSPVVSPVIGSERVTTSGAPTQAGNGGQAVGPQTTGLTQAMVDTQLQRERELAAREIALVQQAAEQRAALLAQQREREAALLTQQQAAQRAAQQAAQAPQFIPGAQVIEQAAPVPVPEKERPPPSKMPGWVVPVMIVTATGAVILLTRKPKRKKR